MDEDLPLKKKLLTKELPLKKTFKKYIQLVALLENPQSTPEQCQVAHQQLLNELSLYEFQIQKANVQADVNKKELEYYTNVYKTRCDDIENVKNEIVDLKERLAYEKIQRQYKEQYLALYKLINEQPTIHDTEIEIEKVKKELEEVDKMNKKTNDKLDLRMKQFQLLLHTIQELEQNLDIDSGETEQQQQTSPQEQQTQSPTSTDPIKLNNSNSKSNSTINEDKMDLN
ncbi:hypothetical protein PPL_06877 [Heterostelium album PN500]|uniref:THO complex subunit 7 n=1 Tax=Heterostelium pallidum (strain ATCC 26659 / Pp 5 / PN500) TaxID=670386 RepID=D3BDS4_HETP5|nr:hypothetical protein PPL_06877 [Heterostelium album PN500]EFA80055.1 hypothetical protein PPL_06877 [Heterostelium album PN500]|eukprot:XP_020432175.1 hypothetical protein PPL_06877 [Heterostelium album PN500]